MQSFFSISTRIASWLFLFLALLSGCSAAFFWLGRIDRQNEWEKATAVVTALSPAKAGEVQYAYFTFSTVAGQELTTRSSWASYPTEYSIGEKVEVIYPPDEPEEASENTFGSQFILPLILTFEPIIMSFLCMACFLVARKLKPHS